MKHIWLRLFLVVALCSCMFCLVGCLGLPGDGQIRFYLDGELYETVTPAEDGNFYLPPRPAENGYTFDGWYADEAGRQPYTNQRKAYGFLRPISYTITYHLDGGVSDNPTFFTAQTPAFTLQAPEKAGYTFIGWTEGASTEVQATVHMPKGSLGDRTFTAHYTPTVFPITYDLDGGSASNPESYTIETPSFTLTPPTREGSTFFAWEKDGVLYDSYTVQQGSVGPLTLRAVWDTGLPMLSYKASVNNIAVTADTPAGGVSSDTRVTICAPAIVDDHVFLYWTCNGARLTSSPSYTLTMGKSSRTLVAVYGELSTTVYDKASAADVVLPIGSSVTPVAVYGGAAGNLWDVRLQTGSATLLSSYLVDLPCGKYTYFVDDGGDGAWFVLTITDTRTPANVAIVYDTVAFPAVVLRFDCACRAEHTYSLDGAGAVSCKSGDVIADYDKTKAHTLTLTCVSSGKQVSVAREGYTAALAKYYTDSFTYGGCTYDLVIESEWECSVLYEYLIAVRGVLDYTAGAELKYDFYFSDAMAQHIYDPDAYRTLMTRVFGSKNFPMSPSVQLSYRQSTPCTCTLTIDYPDGLNAQVSTQPLSTVTASSNLEKTNGRPADAPLAIDAWPTLSVRTLYELELLPYGFCPTFEDASSDAAVVYARARQILYSIIDDSMNDHQKVTAIYRYLAETVTYDRVAFTSARGGVYRAFTSYGALIDRLAVCDGYASAFRLLCHIEGIPCEEYAGRTDPSDPSSGHAWNKYTIDGATYACDVTWARVGDDYITMRYLMMDEATLLDSGHYENAAIDNFFTELCADGIVGYFDRIGTDAGFDLCIESYEELEAAVRLALSMELDYIELRMQESEATLISYLGRLRQAFGRSFTMLTLSGDTVCVQLTP